MGVDVTVFLGRLSPGHAEDPGQFFRVDAMVDTNRTGRDLAARLAAHRGAVPVFFYAPAGDGYTRITEDRYGSRTVGVPLAALHDYQWPPHDEAHALAMLRAMIAAAPPWVTHAVVWCS